MARDNSVAQAAWRREKSRHFGLPQGLGGRVDEPNRATRVTMLWMAYVEQEERLKESSRGIDQNHRQSSAWVDWWQVVAASCLADAPGCPA